MNSVENTKYFINRNYIQSKNIDTDMNATCQKMSNFAPS
jgi:hypothetical protein